MEEALLKRTQMKHIIAFPVGGRSKFSCKKFMYLFTLDM